MSNTKMSKAEVYTKAANLIERYGHTKGQLVDREGRMCIAGAINKAFYGKPKYMGSVSYDSYIKPLDALVTPDAAARFDVILWNNQLERTEQDVVDLLRRAAVELV